ncbi:Fe-S cluster assembly sulfur transfer protein SufU [Aquisalimonas asiatica]|uniref:Nitrogen fixation protein NifU n=1 Tax=Aquisalimonas asiatica TaxID=406100 RepID=A0A1H8SJQ2_9GAMM|nr:SUF system NifU family Fe-S cluster assembly protein [Aquisalimonas asiatica]SEO78912.1 nitrogen fixation protein NifU [Aquisalimonas asiatica]
MADDLLKLYQDVVLAHNRQPHNFVEVDPATHRGHGYNPLCGDRIELTLDVRDGVIATIGFQGESCAIATASASLLTTVLEGRSVDDALAVMDAFNRALDGDETAVVPETLQPLLAVRAFPSRLKCAGLPWASLSAALADDDAAASTEQGQGT